MVVDSQARHEALDITRSVVVTSPAGSGKTGLLTRRFLLLLAVVDQPEQVRAITFTRKAAAEMRHRVFGALTGEGDLSALAAAVLERDAALGWGLLATPSRLQISTFDSFCSGIASASPLASGLGAGVSAGENPDRLYRQAARDLLRTINDDMAPWANALRYLCARMDNDLDRLADLLVSALARRDQWLGFVVGGENLIATQGDVCASLTKSAIAEFADKLSVSRDFLESVFEYAGTNAAPESTLRSLQGLKLNAIDSNAHLVALSSLLSTASGDLRKTVTAKEGFPAASSFKNAAEKAVAKAMKEDFVAWLEVVRGTPMEAIIKSMLSAPGFDLDAEDRKALASLFVVLPLAYSFLKKVFARTKEVDFAEITASALRALEISAASFSDIRHLLVDEFQDTSLPQFELIERLTAGWSEGDGRTLFLVGDAMQSIYRFRDSDVGLFIRAIEHGVGAVKLHHVNLEMNFRSSATVVEFVNQTFQEAFPPFFDRIAGSIPYSPSVAMHDAGAPENISVDFFASEQADRDEAAHLALEVKKLSMEKPEESIAVLVRNRGHLKEIVAAFHSAEVQFSALEIDPLLSSSVAMDLLTVTRCIYDQADDLAWTALMRSPLFGFTLVDLAAVAGAKPPMFSMVLTGEVQVELSEHAATRVAYAAPYIVGSLKNVGRKTPRALVEGLWVALGGAGMTETPAERVAFSTFIEALSSFANEGYDVDARAFAEFLESKYISYEEGPHTNVTVMTIHKSKGLEFDHVFIPGLARGNRPEDKQLLAWQNFPGHGFVLAACPAPGKDNSRQYQFLVDNKKVAARHEATRLLYVACTRARHTLHLLASLGLDDAGELAPPSSSSLLFSIFDGVKHKAVVHSQPIAGDLMGDETKVEGNVLVRITSSAPAFPHQENVLAGIAPAGVANDEAFTLTWSNNWHAKAADVAGELLRHIASVGRCTIPDDFYSEQAVSRLLMKRGVPEAYIAESVSSIVAMVQAAMCEVELGYIFEGGAVAGLSVQVDRFSVVTADAVLGNQIIMFSLGRENEEGNIASIRGIGADVVVWTPVVAGQQVKVA